MPSFEYKTFQLSVGDLLFAGERYGKGERHIFYFHGFGQKCDSVKKFLSDSLLESYTVHSVGLFFHESTFKVERLPESPFEPHELISFIKNYTKANNIAEFHLMGYSIGARLCFEILLNIKIKGLFVIAPDGVTKNIWYTLFTRSSVINKLALILVRNSGISIGLTAFLYRLGIISAYEMRLVHNNINSPEALKNVLNVWSCYSKIYPSFNNWIKELDKAGIPHYFLFGKKDKIITARASNRVLKHSNNVEIVNDGHDLVKEKYSGIIGDFFLTLSEKEIIS